MTADLSKLIGAAVALLFVLYKAPLVWRRRGESDRRLLSAWLFGLAVVPALLFQMDTVFLATARLSGIPNLAWLLSCTFLSLAYHLLSVASLAIIGRSARGLALRLGLFLSLYLVLFFGGGVALAEVYAGTRIPRSPGELLFANAFYLYTLSLVLRTALKLVLAERNDLQLRMLVMFAAAFSLTLLTVLKILSSIYGYRDPALVPERVFSLMTLLLLLSSLLWPAIFLPGRFYQAMGRLWRGLETAGQLWWLSYLCRRAARLYPQPVKLTPWRRQLAEARLHRIRAAVALQDIKTILANRWVSRRDEALLAALTEVDDGLTPEQMATAYARAGRRLVGRTYWRKLGRLAPGRANGRRGRKQVKDEP